MKDLDKYLVPIISSKMMELETMMIIEDLFKVSLKSNLTFFIIKILDRTRDDAPKQVALAYDVNRPALMGPAAIQAPSPMQMLASNVQAKLAIKDNSQNVSNFEHIQALIQLTEATGKYFENWSEDQQLIFKNALDEKVVPEARRNRMVQKIKEIIQIRNKEEAYEQFLEYCFSAQLIPCK